MRFPVAELPIALGPKWIEPEFLIETFGTIGLLCIVFMECGLLAGFFLPGDSLLFTAGLLSANGVLPSIWLLVALIPLAAFAGDQCGYWIGRKAGPTVFARPNSRFFKAEYVDRSQAFFARHGPQTVILARFVPIVRTITPVMAGVGHMRYRTFVTYDIIGALLWGAGVTLLGFYLGQFEFVKRNIEFMIIGIVALSVIPVVLELRRQTRRTPEKQTPPPAPPNERALEQAVRGE